MVIIERFEGHSAPASKDGDSEEALRFDLGLAVSLIAIIIILSFVCTVVPLMCEITCIVIGMLNLMEVRLLYICL